MYSSYYIQYLLQYIYIQAYLWQIYDKKYPVVINNMQSFTPPCNISKTLNSVIIRRKNINNYFDHHICFKNSGSAIMATSRITPAPQHKSSPCHYTQYLSVSLLSRLCCINNRCPYFRTRHFRECPL